MKRALLIVDIQKDYFPGGRGELFEPEKAAANAKAVLDYFRSSGEEVIFIRHESEEKGNFLFSNGSEGTQIYPLLAPLENERVFTKRVPDSFLSNGLADYLKKAGVTELIVCGMMSHMCIDTTVRAAASRGYKVTVLEDACTTLDLSRHGVLYPAQQVHEIFMASLDGAFAKVITTNVFLEG